MMTALKITADKIAITTACPTPADNNTAQTYRLIANPTALSEHVGKKLELVGTIDKTSTPDPKECEIPASAKERSLRGLPPARVPRAARTGVLRILLGLWAVVVYVAYVLGKTPPPTSQPLSNILVFNVAGRTSSAIALVGQAQPIAASLSPDGTLLYVAATDGNVHVVDTQTASDIQQVTFTQDPATLLGGLCSGVTTTCKPNLIAARP